MILFLSQVPDDLLKQYSENLQNNFGIPVVYKTLQEFIREAELCITCIDNKFSSKLNKTDLDNIKLCFLNCDLILYRELFPFEDNFDKDYALQEWNATILCLFESAKNTKFINKFLKPYVCDTEIEHLVLFQKYGIDTVDMVLTNDVNDFLSVRELYNGEVIIKNLIKGYEKSKTFTAQDCSKLDKLYLSPYIFQRAKNGNNAVILNIGNEFLTYIDGISNEIDIPSGLKEKLLKLKKELNIESATFYGLYSNQKFYFYSLNQSFSFSESYGIFGEKFVSVLTDYILKEYKN